ncbi:hypothetical protein RUND412_010478 [Rhizina undulata]
MSAPSNFFLPLPGLPKFKFTLPSPLDIYSFYQSIQDGLLRPLGSPQELGFAPSIIITMLSNIVLGQRQSHGTLLKLIKEVMANVQHLTTAIATQALALRAVQASIALLCASTSSALPSLALALTNLTLVLKAISKINTTSYTI